MHLSDSHRVSLINGTLSAPTSLGKDSAPYTIGKHSRPQNRAKIRQKYSKYKIFGILGVFLPLFGGVFLFCRGPSLSPPTSLRILVPVVE